MTALTLNPELQGLLEELAADPRSCLLTNPRSEIYHSPFDQEHLRASMPGMSALERELVNVHREELAYLLRVACWYALTENKNGCHSPYANASGLLGLPKRDELAARLKLEDKEGHLSGAQYQSARIFEAPQIPGMAALSARLVPAPQPRIYLALNLLDLGRPASARHVLGQKSCRPEEEGFYFSALGRTHFSLGGWAAAAEAYEKASYSGNPRVSPVVCWLLMCVFTEDTRGIGRASGVLQELAPTYDRQLGEWCKRLRRECENRASAQRFSVRPRGNLNSISRRVLHEVL